MRNSTKKVICEDLKLVLPWQRRIRDWEKGCRPGENFRYDLRFTDQHNQEVTSRLKEYIRGQPTLSIPHDALHCKIRKFFDNQREKSKRSAERNDALRGISRRSSRVTKVKKRRSKYRGIVNELYYRETGP